jgi:hypothetical protein
MSFISQSGNELIYRLRYRSKVLRIEQEEMVSWEDHDITSPARALIPCSQAFSIDVLVVGTTDDQ